VTTWRSDDKWFVTVRHLSSDKPLINCFVSMTVYPTLLSTHADRQGGDISFTAFFVCLFVRLRISSPRINLAASNCTRRFIGVQGRESPILGNFASPEAQNRTNRPARHHLHDVHNDYPLAPKHTAACGRRIGMCGYTSVPEDRRTC